MKFSKDKVKRKIEKRMWKKLRDYVKKRSKGYCELCARNGKLVKGQDVDHCFSASGASVFRWDVQNLTMLCKGCHTQKSFCVHGVEKDVDEVVKTREGINWYISARYKSKQIKRWEVADLEDQEAFIDELLERQKARYE